ncbi:MAG: XTP/dITP diphosphatase [Nitrospirae bacterium]|nr:XTP/dITP diphosphatase [Nitrospirota bacterium]
MNIVLATRNKKKVEEMKRIFAGYDIRFLTLDSFPGCPDVEEDGKTFRANAVKKAVFIANFTGCAAIADDSGLEVSVLGGAPGVYSARYAGNDADDQKNVKKLLREMMTIQDDQRGARFVCCIAFALPDGKYKTFTGYAKGLIGRKKKGYNGFGYDPVFYPAGHARTFAEMADSEKDLLSHRGRAMRKLYNYIKDHM